MRRASGAPCSLYGRNQESMQAENEQAMNASPSWPATPIRGWPRPETGTESPERAILEEIPSVERLRFRVHRHASADHDAILHILEREARTCRPSQIPVLKRLRLKLRPSTLLRRRATLPSRQSAPNGIAGVTAEQHSSNTCSTAKSIRSHSVLPRMLSSRSSRLLCCCIRSRGPSSARP